MYGTGSPCLTIRSKFFSPIAAFWWTLSLSACALLGRFLVANKKKDLGTSTSCVGCGYFPVSTTQLRISRRPMPVIWFRDRKRSSTGGSHSRKYWQITSTDSSVMLLLSKRKTRTAMRWRIKKPNKFSTPSSPSWFLSKFINSQGIIERPSLSFSVSSSNLLEGSRTPTQAKYIWNITWTKQTI